MHTHLTHLYIKTHHTHTANKSKAQAQHEVFPGSAKDGIIALQGHAAPRGRPARSYVSESRTCKNIPARGTIKIVAVRIVNHISPPLVAVIIIVVLHTVTSQLVVSNILWAAET